MSGYGVSAGGKNGVVVLIVVTVLVGVVIGLMVVVMAAKNAPIEDHYPDSNWA